LRRGKEVSGHREPSNGTTSAKCTVEGRNLCTHSITTLFLEQVLSKVLDNREQLAACRVDGGMNTVGACSASGSKTCVRSRIRFTESAENKDKRTRDERKS